MINPLRTVGKGTGGGGGLRWCLSSTDVDDEVD